MTDFDPIAYIAEPRWQESRLGLDRIRALLDCMGRPQDRLRFVHVAGTNGKGSTCAYMASVLQAAGYRTGLFTSPGIACLEERIRVDGVNISSDDLRQVTLLVRDCAEAVEAETGEHPTEFELMTAVAFEHFARSACDVVVCEVGLGGRLDSTNVIDAPEVCVITRIGLDHTALLGDTLQQIAREKAAIAKPGAAVVSWPQDDPAALEEIVSTARAVGAGEVAVPDFSNVVVGRVEGAMRRFSYDGVEYRTRLLGSYQPFNAAVALEALRALVARGWNMPPQARVHGVAAAVWPGRFEVMQAGPPPVVVDGGHNPQGATVLADSLRDVFPGREVTFVMGVLADKDYRAMVREVLPLARAFVCASPDSPRALPAGDLAAAIAAEAGRQRPPVEVAGDYARALKRARDIAGPEGLVCAFGSLYAVEQVRAALA